MEFLEAEFTQHIGDDLIDSGVIDGFELCHYRSSTGNLRVDGYWFNDVSLDLFITDFSNRETIQSLTQTEVLQVFKRVENFFTASAEKNLFHRQEETSQGCGLARNIAERVQSFSKANFFLVSECVLSERLKVLEDKKTQVMDFCLQHLGYLPPAPPADITRHP